MNELSTNDLHALSAKAQAAFSTIEDGEFISRNALLAAGLTADDCATAHKLEWQRKREGEVYPGQSLDARKDGVQRAAGNLTIPRRAVIWEAMRELLAGDETHTGRLQMATRSDKEGPFRAILFHGRAKIRDDVADLPMLLLDATCPVEVVRHYLPRLNVLAEVKAVAPYMQVHQVVGGWGKTSIVPSDKAAPEENRRREGLVGELTDFVRMNSGGNTLVITYEAIEERFSNLPGVRTGHFNAISGLDTFGDVRSLFVIGRPLADARHLRDDALALTGRPIPAESGRMQSRGALMHDGTGAAVNVRTYADPTLEAMRAAVTDAEVIQAIGRGRGTNRTADKPLNVFVCADVVLPLPVNRLARWVDLRLNVMERMAARGAVLFGPSDAVKAYPDLFPTTEAAKKAIQRSNAAGVDFGDISLRRYILGECPRNSLQRVLYRPAGRGQQTRHALVAADRLPALRAWLEALFGPLTHLDVVAPADLSPPPEPPDQAPKTQPATVMEPAVSADPDDSHLWPADDPGWDAEPGWTPDNPHDHELEDVAIMETCTTDDRREWWCPPDELRQPAALLDPGRIYPAVAGWRFGVAPVADMLRISGLALPEIKAGAGLGLFRPPPDPGSLPRPWPG